MTELARDAPEYVRDALVEMSKNQTFAWKTQAQGSSTSLVSALDPKLGMFEDKDGKENYGVYLIDCQISNGLIRAYIPLIRATRDEV